jgi:hypothetical protein
MSFQFEGTVMTKTYFAYVRTAAVGAALVVVTATAAHAQATRTWVSGVGDDVNPCSRTAPCKTFAGAISKTAVGGFIDVLDPGSFGAVTITKSITIDGSGGSIAGITASGTQGIVINSATAVVHLRHLQIEGPGTGTPSPVGLNGVNVVAAAQVHIEKCVIANFSLAAVNYNAAAGFLFVSDTTIQNNTANGIVVTHGRATIENLHANANGTGVLVNGNAIATVRNSYFGGNGVGVQASANASAVANVHNSVITNNTFGITAANAATVRVSNSMIASNSNTGLSNDGVSFIVSLQGNDLVGNVFQGTFTSTVIKQ